METQQKTIEQRLKEAKVEQLQGALNELADLEDLVSTLRCELDEM
jgi:hypothetical protein